MAEPLGVRFVLDGVDEITFVRILNDLMHDVVFAKPLQVQIQAPHGGEPGEVTIAFHPELRTRALQAVQRFKGIMLDHGVQVDSYSVPAGPG